MEGVIQTMNKGAEEIFGYSKDELIGKKRVSIFSPGEIVLQNVEDWLNKAVKNGSYEGKTIFLNKKQEIINAKIRITPTYHDGKKSEQTGYCGVTEIIDENVDVKINFSTKLIKWLAITRMPFTSASILPILVVAAYFAYVGDDLFNILSFLFCILGVIFAHLSINVFNDYFDNLDGTDDLNNEYFQQLSGGSRAIELGLITIKKTKKLAINLFLFALLFGGIVISQANPVNLIGIIVITLVSSFLGYFYTAPPLRLVARRGLGELSIFLTFGPLLTLGTALAIFDGDLFLQYEYLITCILLGVPSGLLTTNILVINQFPDMKSDKKTGKNHLVVTFGRSKSRWIYAFILFCAVFSGVYLAYIIDNYLLLIPSLITAIIGFITFKILFKNYKNRKLVKANWLTIYIQALYCLVLLLVFLV